MKVKELIAQLEKLDPDLSVLGYCEEDEDDPDGHLVTRIFEIEHVDVSDAETSRNEDGRVQFKFQRSDLSTRVAFINLLSDI